MAATILNLHQEISYDNITCYKCGIVFWVPAYFKEKRISDKKTFYCPGGHDQSYTGESDANKAARLKRELEASQARASELWEQQKKLATANRNLRKRAKDGVCPCCKRTFKALAAHMAAKHPEFNT
jgi:hypothetical protein